MTNAISPWLITDKSTNGFPKSEAIFPIIVKASPTVLALKKIHAKATKMNQNVVQSILETKLSCLGE